jgi:6-phosphogluconolactonase (cycloisomerase 2 family)
LSAAPFSAAISPNGGFLYLGTAAGIFVYSVNGSTGALTLLNNGSVISSDPAFAMTVAPSGGWLIETVSLTGTVNAIPLDPTSGLLITGGTEQTVSLPSGAAAVQELAITQNGAANPYVFAAMGTTGLAVIPFNAASSGNPFGTPKTVSPKNTGGGATAVAVDLSSQVVYVGETVAVTSNTKNPGGVRMFTIGANATLTEVSGSPYGTGGLGPSAILPTTHFIYAADKAVTGSNNGQITAFAINTSGGVATSLTAVTSGTISAGVSTVGLAEDSTGTYILAVNSSGTPDLNAYTIGTTGALTSYATNSTGADPVQAVAIVAP